MNPQNAEFIPASGYNGTDARFGPLRFRELTPHDKGLQEDYFNNLSNISRQARFMSAMQVIPEQMLDQLSSIDGRRHVAVAAERYDGAYQMIAEARYVLDEDRRDICEFAISVHDTWQGYGLGKKLLAELERKARSMGVEKMVGETSRDNKVMTNLARRQGFSVEGNSRDASTFILSKPIAPLPASNDGTAVRSRRLAV